MAVYLIYFIFKYLLKIQLDSGGFYISNNILRPRRFSCNILDNKNFIFTFVTDWYFHDHFSYRETI